MTKTIKIENVIDSEEKILKLKQDILKAALYLYETGRPDWYIAQFANTKLDFLNGFIELENPYNNDLSCDSLVYAGKSSLLFNIDLFDIFVTDYYKSTCNESEILIENSPLRPYKQFSM